MCGRPSGYHRSTISHSISAVQPFLRMIQWSEFEYNGYLRFISFKASFSSVELLCTTLSTLSKFSSIPKERFDQFYYAKALGYSRHQSQAKNVRNQKDKHMGSESVSFLRQNNVGVVIHDERDFNAVRTPHEQENGVKETLQKGKGKMSMGKENIALMDSNNNIAYQRLHKLLAVRIPQEQENELEKTLRKGKGKMPMDKESVALMPMESVSFLRQNNVGVVIHDERDFNTVRTPHEQENGVKENIAPMDSNNNGISKTAQAQCARLEREKLLAVRIPHEQENELEKTLRKGKGKMSTNKESVAPMPMESVSFLHQNNVGVVIHDERDFNAVRISHEQENGIKENIAPMDSNNNGISKAAQAQRARRERKKLLAVRIPHEQENELIEALRKGKCKMSMGKENVALTIHTGFCSDLNSWSTFSK